MAPSVALARAKHGEKAEKSLLPAVVRVYSLAMNPRQKQFSLTGFSLKKKQIPTSSDGPINKRKQYE